jgi:MoxR-like ATPase
MSMTDYTFQLINRNLDRPLPADSRQQLLRRPCIQIDNSLKGTAPRYRPDEALENAINTAIAVGEPLLLTGEPGTGKTQAAYYVAYQLGTQVFHFQTKSNSTGNDLLYDFDTVRYFHDAHLAKLGDGASHGKLNRRDYVSPGELWKAFTKAEEAGFPTVVLIDEIDKAPRDFPNDLLHEVDQMEFSIKEVGDWTIRCRRELRPLLFITSNDERRLPPAFLRRCVTHHIELTDQLLQTAVDSHRDMYPELDNNFLKTAIECFLRIRGKTLEKPPATGELLAWLQVLSAATGSRPDVLNADLKDLPYLGTLLKHPEDFAALRR